MTRKTVDFRRKPNTAVGKEIVKYYNQCPENASFDVQVSQLDIPLKIALLEAGIRYKIVSSAPNTSTLSIWREAVPAQASIPGIHHVVGDAENIWVCERGKRAARIEIGTHNLAAQRVIAKKASHMAIHPAINLLVVADPEAEQLVFARADNLTIQQTCPAPGKPQLPLINEDGFVCVTGGTTGTLTVTRPEGTSHFSRTIPIGESPHDPILGSDQKHVFVPCTGSDEIVKVRLADAIVVGRCTVGSGPSHLALHPNGKRLYSANSWSGTISCISEHGEWLAESESGPWAHAISVTPDGHWVYVANFFDDTLSVFDSTSLSKVATLSTEPYPHGLDVSPDGRYLIATGFGSPFIRLYDPKNHRQIARIYVGLGSSHTVFSGSQNNGTELAYVGCSVADCVACVDLLACECTQTIRMN